MTQTEGGRQSATGGAAKNGRTAPTKRGHWIKTLAELLIAGIAIAGVLVVVLLGSLSKGPSWKLADPSATGHLIADRDTVVLRGGEDLGDRLAPGTTLARPDSTALLLRAGDQLWIQIAPGGEIVLPKTAGKWWGREIEAWVLEGATRFSTGPDLAALSYYINTRIARIEVLGATIAVIDSPDSTRVCVLAGQVKMGRHSRDPELVPAAMCRVLYRDHIDPHVEEIRAPERARLQALRDRAFAHVPVE